MEKPLASSRKLQAGSGFGKNTYVYEGCRQNAVEKVNGKLNQLECFG
jgi:hypothetical protein